MLKRWFGKRPGSLAAALGAALGLTLTPALTRSSAAGTGPVYWPQAWPQQWPTQSPEQGPPPASQQAPPQWPSQWPQQAPPQWNPDETEPPPQPWPLPGPGQEWELHPVGTLYSGLADLWPDDVAITDWYDQPLVLWRDYPVTLVDVRSVLDDDQINSLLDAIDTDPVASDNADGLTGWLQQSGVLPDQVFVVGADLVDGPPAFFVLPG